MTYKTIVRVRRGLVEFADGATGNTPDTAFTAAQALARGYELEGYSVFLAATSIEEAMTPTHPLDPGARSLPTPKVTGRS